VIVDCPACSQPNRIPARHLADRGRCGSCKAELGPLAVPLDVDENDFDDIVRNARVPVLVDFWAAWCGPCRMVAPEVKKAAQTLAGRAVVLKVDSDRNPSLSSRYRVSSIPNFLIFSGGKLVKQEPGAVTHQVLVSRVEQVRSAAGASAPAR
jgi:thioredoxin 2